LVSSRPGISRGGLHIEKSLFASFSEDKRRILSVCRQINSAISRICPRHLGENALFICLLAHRVQRA